ncbi:MAG TPA: hypothetical protein DDW49_10295 [Deltaproteobacteria bacterium]|nr:MAG: hypothetical protein A2048_08115 [Deltaproteobacteria bacterium GWA2_45_12]HBF13752.1 hypothetical protein [Deltaproteobacteria bacterium]
MKRFHPNIYWLGLLSFFNDVTSDMITPFLPAYLKSLGYGAALLGLMEGLAQFVSYATMLASGWMADRTGENKKITIFGYSLSAVARLSISIPYVGVVLSGRVIDRLGKGIRTAPRDALMTASESPKNWARAFGLQRAMDHAGALLGASVASFVLYKFSISYSILFLAACFPSVLALFFIAPRISNIPKKIKEIKPRLSWKALNPSVKFYIVIIFISALSTPSELFLILKLQDLGMPVYQSAWAWLLMTATSLVAAYGGGNLGDKKSRRFTIGLGWMMFIVAYVCFAFNQNLMVGWGLMALYGLQAGIVEASERAYAATVAHEDARGTVMGWYYLAYGLGLFPASILFGWIWKVWGDTTAFLLNAAITFVALVLLFFLPSDRKNSHALSVPPHEVN